MSNIRALCTTFGLALASIVFAVVSPVSAQFVTLGAQGCSGGGCAGGSVTLSLDCSGSCPTATGGTTTQTVTLSTTKTNDIIIVSSQSNGVTVSSVADVAGLSWTRRASVVAGGASTDVEEWWAKSTGILTSDVITITYSGSASFSIATAFGINGAHTASPFDTNAALPNTNTGGDPTFTTSNANDFLIASSANTCTPASPWTGIEATSFWTVQYQIVSATQSGSTAPCAAVSIGDAIIQGP